MFATKCDVKFEGQRTGTTHAIGERCRTSHKHNDVVDRLCVRYVEEKLCLSHLLYVRLHLQVKKASIFSCLGRANAILSEEPPACSDITNDQLGISGETGHGGTNLYIY